MKLKYLLGNGYEAARGSCVQWSPSLIVAAIDVGSLFNEELHHVQVIVDARLSIKQ